MSDKLILSHDGALKKKYGAAGLKSIRQAIDRLVKADGKRGLTSSYISLDDAKTMKSFGAKVVSKSGDQKAVKKAIDALFASIKPDYLMILGSIDVIPHQKLKNPLWDPSEPFEDEQWTFSDLPYACAVPWSNDPSDFIAPSRVVGRLADHTGAKSTRYLLSLLANATSPTQLKKNSITPFGISTETWKVSTNKALARIFGGRPKAKLSPVGGPRWTKAELKSGMHFINCHGGPLSPLFSGEPGDVIAHDAAWIDGKIAPGTVAAVECCFGAELYDPRKAGGRQGIGQTYLACGATAYVGSTNSAYGPESDNDNADLICLFFLQEVLKGRSSGDAFLTARLRYVKDAPPPMDATDLKTLSQFILLGDPSIHPVLVSKASASPAAGVNSGGVRKASTAGFSTARPARKSRRRESAEDAGVIGTSTVVGSKPIAPPVAAIATILSQAMKKAGVGEGRMATRSFGTVIGAGSKRKAVAKGKDSDLRVHFAAAYPLLAKAKAKGSQPKPPIIVVREKGGKVLQVKTLYVKSTPNSPRPRR